MAIIREFRSFIQRGNVLDLAVGVVIGSAFGKIVDSLVSDVIMPPIGYLVGGINFTDIKLHLGTIATGVPDITLNVGSFLQVCVEFLIVAFSVFMVVKGFNRMQTRQKESPPAPPAPSPEEKLLTEIRDLLKK
ncbi:MAG: large-conductance mechanosensitive channel [Bacteroidota bacterium]|jgi:large conductance mechanosensitive channel